MRNANLKDLDFSNIVDEDRYETGAVFFAYHKLDFKDVQTDSLNINDFNTKFGETKEINGNTIGWAWTKRKQAQNLKHIDNLETLGITLCEADPK